MRSPDGSGKRGRDGNRKGYSPFSGVGQRLGDSSGQTLRIPRTEHHPGSSSVLGGSPGRLTDATSLVVDVEEDLVASAPVPEHWAILSNLPRREELLAESEQPWTLSRLVPESVRMDVFADGRRAPAEFPW